jgi:hypothetical protein
VFEFSLSNPSAVDTTYTFTFTNGTAGADYTTTSQTVPAGTTGTVSYQQLLILLQNPMRPLLLLWNASATGTINDNDNVQL